MVWPKVKLKSRSSITLFMMLKKPDLTRVAFSLLPAENTANQPNHVIPCQRPGLCEVLTGSERLTMVG